MLNISLPLRNRHINLAAPKPMSVLQLPAVLANPFRGAVSCIDSSMMGLFVLREQGATASCTVTVARELREHGGWAVKIVLAIDAYSVYAAVTAQMVKTPAEESLISHVQFLRELLDKGILDYISWLDTRDMIDDGLTKGQVDRVAVRGAPGRV